MVMTERDFWHFVWLCARVPFAGLPWWQAVPLAAWGAQLLIRRRYLGV